MKKELSFIALFTLVVIGAKAAGEEPAGGSKTQIAKTAVIQNEDTLETTQLQINDFPTFEFDANGTLIMTHEGSDNAIGKVPIKYGAKVAVEFDDIDSTKNNRPVTISSAGYSTIYSAFNIIIPEDVEAYIPNVSGSKVYLNDGGLIPAGTIVPAWTGLLLKNAGNYQFQYTENDGTEINTDFEGGVIATPVTDFNGRIYSLAKENGVTAFYKYRPETTVAGRAFIVVNNSGNEVKSLALTFGYNVNDIKDMDNIIPSNDRCVNIAGWNVKPNSKGFIIKNRKTYFNR